MPREPPAGPAATPPRSRSTRGRDGRSTPAELQEIAAIRRELLAMRNAGLTIEEILVRLDQLTTRFYRVLAEEMIDSGPSEGSVQTPASSPEGGHLRSPTRHRPNAFPEPHTYCERVAVTAHALRATRWVAALSFLLAASVCGGDGGGPTPRRRSERRPHRERGVGHADPRSTARSICMEHLVRISPIQQVAGSTEEEVRFVAVNGRAFVETEGSFYELPVEGDPSPGMAPTVLEALCFERWAPLPRPGRRFGRRSHDRLAAR